MRKEERRTYWKSEWTTKREEEKTKYQQKKEILFV